jgi:hypothetical protein
LAFAVIEGQMIKIMDWVDLSEIIRNMGLTVAAVVGSALAWRQLSPASSQAKSANAQAELARRAHVTELFIKAAGQLRDQNLEVRLAAIYVLREAAKGFPDLADPVFDLLQAYLRHKGDEYEDEVPPVDVSEILKILASRLGDV